MQPQVEINLNNLCHNFGIIRNTVGDAKIMGVVKADAYGHGVIPISKALVEAGIDGFCVALISEIQELRNNDINLPILHLGCFNHNYLDLFDNRTYCSLNSLDDIANIEKYHSRTGIQINAHVKFDTGMGRLGFSYHDATNVLNQLANSKSINLKGVYSHFSTSEEVDTDYMELQRKRFLAITQLADTIIGNDLDYHIANSGGIFSGNDNHFDMVRPGIILYGVTPFGKTNTQLKPVMEFKAPVVIVKSIAKGESIGYNRTYIAPKNMDVALVQAGYADGVPMEFSNNGQVTFNDRQFPILGKVSMDLVCIDCTINRINVGDMVTFWGSDISKLDIISEESKKSPYNFLTGITKRVIRKYI